MLQQSQYVPQQGMLVRRIVQGQQRPAGPGSFADGQFAARAQMFRGAAPGNNAVRTFAVRPGAGGNNPGGNGGGLPGGSPHTVGGGRGPTPASPPKNSSSSGDEGDGGTSSSAPSLLHRAGESGSSSFGGSTFHVGPSSTVTSYGAEHLPTSVFVSLDYPSSTITSPDGCVSSEVLLSLGDGSPDVAALAASEDEDASVEQSRVALVVVGEEGEEDGTEDHGITQQEEPLDVAVVVETVGTLPTPECEAREDGSSPSGSEGGIDMAISGCGDLHHRSTPAGDHNYSNLPPEGADSELAKKISEGAHFFDHMNMGMDVKIEDRIIRIADEKPCIEKIMNERTTPPQAVKTPSPPLAPVSTSAMSFPASVTHTLNFTLRQTGMPQTVRLPHDEGQLVVLPAKTVVPVVPQLSPSPPLVSCEPLTVKTEPMPPAGATTPPLVLRMHPVPPTPPPSVSSAVCTPHSAPLRWSRSSEVVAVKEEVLTIVPPSMPPTPPPPTAVVIKQEARTTPSPCLAICHKQTLNPPLAGTPPAATPVASPLIAAPAADSTGLPDSPTTGPVGAACATMPAVTIKVEPGTTASLDLDAPPPPPPPAAAAAVEESPAVKACEGSVEEPEGSTGGKQNVLLKQLLQNCPSAETHKPLAGDLPEVTPSSQPGCRKSENGPSEAVMPAVQQPVLSRPSSPPNEQSSASSDQATTPALAETAENAEATTPATTASASETQPSQPAVSVATGQAPGGTMATTPSEGGDKPEETKVRKLSYLDIRRAQLEREPTPPPPSAEDLALRRQQQRKRPKKPRPPPLAPSGSEAAGAGPDGPRPPSHGGGGAARAKRPRKGSRADEDYEVYLETLMQRLRALPPVRIIEPHIRPNFNIGAVFGRGDLNLREPVLKGSYGRAFLPGQPDPYSVLPFGDRPPPPSAPSSAVTPSPTPLRGFYNQEFSMHTRVTSGGADSNRCREADSPDTIVGASSPECAMFEAPFRFRSLQLVDEDSNDSARSLPSPTVPIVAPIPVKAVPPPQPPPAPLKILLDEKDKENTFPGDKLGLCRSRGLPGAFGGGPPPVPLRESGNVSVTLTLTSEAAGDIQGLLCSLAKLLQVEPPSSYDIIERTTTPPSQKLGLYKHNHKHVTSVEEAEYLVDGKQRFCRHCEIMVSKTGMVKKQASELNLESGVPKEDGDEEAVYFCSSNCYMQFALAHRTPSSAAAPQRKEAAVVCHAAKEEHGGFRGECCKERLTNKFDEDEEPCIKQEEDDRATTPQEETRASAEDNNSDSRLLADEEDSQASMDSTHRKRAARHSISKEQEPMVKKWKNVRWKLWSGDLVGATKYEPPSEEEVGQLLDAQDIFLKPETPVEDTRQCILCHDIGDGETNGPARLLNLDVDLWVHLNCALWSQEVYETCDGALMNVASACRRALLVNCSRCHRTGASLHCFRIRCPAAFHFACASLEGCSFYKDKTILCPQHTPRVPNIENVLESVAVFRRVYISRDEHKQVASMFHKGEQNLLRVGSLIFLSIGQLLPHQLQNFHTQNCIYPVGYKVVRIYWSMHKLGARSRYTCSIHDVDGQPQFQIRVSYKGQEKVLTHRTPKGVWQKVLQPIESFRRETQAIKVFSNFITGEDLFGLTEPAIVRITESLPGVETLSDYNFRYGRSPLLELPLAINPTGCARSEPKLRTHFKRPHTMHTSNTLRPSLQTLGAGGGGGSSFLEASSPYTKHFVHSKSSQYRRMKTEWRNNVYLARSGIQGLGLYAARDIECHTMIIEYIGQLIRNEIAERNEAIYEAQNRGVYMFRLDENRVIDATLSGGLARYINHSCSPNCVAELVQIDRENKILIIANRRITRGEELTYDYKFDYEDDGHKIPCLCSASNCRKWMN
uniref:Histone-lysine N-methyltransferase MLL3 n=1 Tax=Rhipicephalus appendiculatus TaxID=34631 RepID=A0A131YLZ0_RHIAP